MIAASDSGGGAAWREAAKLTAFLRRDFLTAWSYRLAFVSDLVNLVAQVVVFSFVSRLVDPARVPRFGGEQPTYLAFVVVGIAISALLQLGLNRVGSALRNEQLLGTLESLLVTPTSELTILLGLVAYDLVYLPVQITMFLAAVTVLFGVEVHLSGIVPAAAVFAVFVPFAGGLGAASAAAVLRFRRAPVVIGLAGYGLAVGSGAYFPRDLLPGWLAGLAASNPVAIALDAVRQVLLGGGGWAAAGPALLVLAPVSAGALAGGVWLFRLALRAERRSGTLGQY
ncbi:MAG: ABC transporter permease [Armatimonadota bacterium]|nr:ABC transporter permease [Armatimonadota bacterium]